MKVLPKQVVNELKGIGRSQYRTTTEKRFALALLAGDVLEVAPSASYWCGRPADKDGCVVHKSSIVTHGGIHVAHRPVLYAILDFCKIRFSGCAGHEPHSYAQASWLPSKTADTWSFERMDLPLMVCYFNELKTLSK